MNDLTLTLYSIVNNIRSVLSYKIFEFNGLIITVGVILGIPLVLLLLRLFFKFFSQF